ncbi:MAG: hypothetical protein ACK41T_11620 [Pseudobdellovibrio sp.]
MRRHLRLFIIAFLLISSWGHTAFAQSPENDDSFDPFSDYNEYEQETEEEADINFLKNGRYLTLAAITGFRGFTDGFSRGYHGNLTYGAQFSYFFDLNMAAALSYSTGDYGVSFNSYSTPDFSSFSKSYSGTVNIQIFDLQLKYYFNTDNVTKGLADLNPYFTGGTAYVTRSYKLSQTFDVEADKVFGLRVGGGIEIPLSMRRYYLGLQAMYTFVQFPDESKSQIDEGDEGTSDPKYVDPRLKGDTYEINVILGTNF